MNFFFVNYVTCSKHGLIEFADRLQNERTEKSGVHNCSTTPQKPSKNYRIPIFNERCHRKYECKTQGKNENTLSDRQGVKEPLAIFNVIIA